MSLSNPLAHTTDLILREQGEINHVQKNQPSFMGLSIHMSNSKYKDIDKFNEPVPHHLNHLPCNKYFIQAFSKAMAKHSKHLSSSAIHENAGLQCCHLPSTKMQGCKTEDQCYSNKSLMQNGQECHFENHAEEIDAQVEKAKCAGKITYRITNAVLHQFKESPQPWLNSSLYRH